MKGSLCLLTAVALLSGMCLPDIRAQRIVVDPATQYQTIDGFGGMNHTTWVEDLDEDQRIKAFSNESGKMGLSILRVHVDPSSQRFSEQIPTARYAVSQGAKVLASPWDPPSELLDYSGNDPRLPYENYGAYVEHLNSFNALMNDNGVPLYAISIQNEPDIGEWTDWTPAEILTFAHEFAGEISTRVLAAESFNFKRNYTDPILNDSAASANVDIIGGHIYGAGLYDYPLAREKGKQVWMTEHLTGSDAPGYNNWSLALNLGKEIHDCMEANFSAYIWWYIRRFYGLILEDGNISEKGWVMMHYSKFIRPGAIRVGATVSSAKGIYSTAYKTDTSMCIVALNITGGDQELVIDIGDTESGDFVTFTSSPGNWMVSQGMQSAGNGTFNVTLPPRSISTITTSHEAGGRYDNIRPIAEAGEDRLILLDQGESGTPFTLDATASSDPDGHIVTYSWSINNVEISNSSIYELTLPEGVHSFRLMVMDNEGATRLDTIVIQVESRCNTDLWYEAECMEVGSAWEFSEDNSASNAYCVTTPAGTQQIEAPSDLEEDHIRIDFSLEEEGGYKVWARVVALHGGDNSFWIRMDNSDWILWEGIPPSYFWQWDDVHENDDSNPVVFNLDAGDHTLFICYREDGAILDKILLSNTGMKPLDIGGLAEGCTVVGLETDPQDAGLRIYPNPSEGWFRMEWEQGFTNLVLVSMDGKVLLSRYYSFPHMSEDVKLELDAGLYLLRIFDENKHVTKRIIIQ